MNGKKRFLFFVKIELLYAIYFNNNYLENKKKNHIQKTQKTLLILVIYIFFNNE